jgi:hypothetical protein
MEGRQVKRSGKAAGSGGVGNVGELAGLAFFCHLCKISFSDINDHGFHMLTEHASESEKDNDVSNPNPPRSFVSNPDIGPKDGSFQAFDPERIKQELNECLARSQETVVVPEIPHPLNPESSNFFGDFRGIPGCNNSCYLDVFFMMLAFSSRFDGIYTQEALNSSVLLRIILFGVVIPLRTRMSVSRDVIAMIRQLMFQKTNRKDYLGDIFDLEEFLMHLCEDVNFNSICNFVNSSDIDGAIVCPLVLSIVSLDRKGVHASLQASILYTLNAKETSLNDLPTAFFARVRPGNFDLPPLVLPQTHVYLETGTYIDGEHVVDNLLRSNYTLSAIVCIRLSHYVVFQRLRDGEWFFFDSMRKIDSGHHVPTSTHVPNFQDYLESGCDESLLTLKSDASPGESRDSFHERVMKHAYAYLFTAEVSKESERVGLPAEKPLLDARRMWEASQQTANAHLHVMQLGQFSSQSSSARGGAAAVLEQPAPSSRKPSAGGGAVSRPHLPLKPSAGGGAVSRPQPPQKPSAGGGAVSRPHLPLKPSAGCGAAADQHQTFSFGHAQSTHHPEKYDGSEISGLRYNGAFYDAITALIKKSASYPDSFLVNNLTLVWDDLQKACNDGVWVSGSFGFSDGPVKHLFRAVGFRFYDDTVVNHTGTAASLSDCETKTKFVERMNKKWRSSMITSILFAKCN